MPLHRTFAISCMVKRKQIASGSQLFKEFMHSHMTAQQASAVRNFISEKEQQGITLSKYDARFKSADACGELAEHDMRYFLGNLKYGGLVVSSPICGYVKIK